MSRWFVAPAPGRPFGRPGVLWAVLLVLGVAACDTPAFRDERAVLELEGDTVRLERGATLHEVRLGTAGSERIEPDTTRARPGDVVRFVAANARTHAVVFNADELPPAARAYLERTGQLRGPPLIQKGAAWVVSLEEAPPGAYPFTCMMHETRGVLIVAQP